VWREIPEIFKDYCKYMKSGVYAGTVKVTATEFQ
jgi:hypothetical protein